MLTNLRLHNSRLALLAFAVSVLFPGQSQAQTVPPAPDQDADRLQWSLGGGAVVSPRPYVDTDPQVIPIPVVTARYKRLFFQGIRGGADLFRKDKWIASVFGQAQFKGLEAEDSSFLEGMETRKKSMDGGVELSYRGRPVGFRAAFLQDLLSRSKGQEASFLVTTGAPLGPVLLLVGVGPRWLSANRVDYYYGVRPSEARPGRPVFYGQSTWDWDLNLTARVKIGKNWSFFALFNREALTSNIQDSPLIDQSASYGLVMYLGRNF